MLSQFSQSPVSTSCWFDSLAFAARLKLWVSAGNHTRTLTDFPAPSCTMRSPPPGLLFGVHAITRNQGDQECNLVLHQYWQFYLQLLVSCFMGSIARSLLQVSKQKMIQKKYSQYVWWFSSPAFPSLLFLWSLGAEKGWEFSPPATVLLPIEHHIPNEHILSRNVFWPRTCYFLNYCPETCAQSVISGCVKLQKWGFEEIFLWHKSESSNILEKILLLSLLI